MTEREYTGVITLVSALWLNSAWTADTAKAAESLLLDLDAGLVLAAVEALAAEGREFAPPPGVVRLRATTLAHPALPELDQALKEVADAVSSVGIYRTPEFSHPAIQAAVDAITWQEVCNSTNPEAFRAHFLRLYGTTGERAKREAASPESVRELVAGLDLRLDRVLGP